MKKALLIITIILLVTTTYYISKNKFNNLLSPSTYSVPEMKKYINKAFGFEFEYPNNMDITEFSYEKTSSSGIMLREKNDKTSSGILIPLPVMNDFAIKPNYRNINDFKTNYITNHYRSSDTDKISLRTYAEVRIDKQQEYTINDNQVLRQVYSYGYQQADGTLDTSEETSEKNSLRYIISDNNKFFIIKAINMSDNDVVDKQLQTIVKSFKIKK